MNVKLEKFDSGWVTLSIALGKEEIELLIRRLNELKSGGLGHFHFFRNDDCEAAEGVADIEITTIGEDEADNMLIN